MFRHSPVLASAILFLTLAGCASPGAGSSAGQALSQSQVTTQRVQAVSDVIGDRLDIMLAKLHSTARY